MRRRDCSAAWKGVSSYGFLLVRTGLLLLLLLGSGEVVAAASAAFAAALLRFPLLEC